MPYTTPGHLGTGAAVTVVITAGGFYRLAGDGAAFGAGPGGVVSDHARGQGPWPGQRGSSSPRTMAKAAGSALSRTAAASDKFPGSWGHIG